MSDCDRCGLNRRFFVSGIGPEHSRVAIVGEAPGRTEARLKEPFVGDSGKLLFGTLKQAGLERDEVYITNVCKCWPPANAKPSKVQMQCCTGLNGKLLVEELKQHGVEIVIALGNTALEILTGRTGITSCHGEAIPATADPSLTVMPILHPAAILRNINYFPDFARDLTRVVALSRGGQLAQPGEVTTTVIHDNQEAIDFLQSLYNQPVAFDIETSGYNGRTDYLLCAVFSTSGHDSVVLPGDVLYDENVQAALKEVMESEDRHILWITHNGQFDIAFFQQQLGVRAKIGFDTLLAHYALDENSTHDLKVLAASYLGAPDWEADIKKYLAHPKKDSYAGLPPKVLHKYNGLDGAYTYQLYELFNKELNLAENADLHKLFYELLMPATNALIDLTLDGVKIDVERLELLKQKAAEDAKEARKAMFKLIGRPFNPNAPAQIQKILYDELNAPTADHSMTAGVPPELTAPSGMAKMSPRTTAMFQLERLTYHGGKVGEFCTELVRYRRSAKLASTYLANYQPEDDGRIHPSYMAFATVTGRLASSRPNVLNMPHIGGIRGLIVAEEGNSILVADYGQNELRVLAVLSQAPGLMQIYYDGRDIHDETTKSFYGNDYSKKQRMIAKSFNFGLVYGRSAQSMAAAFGLSVAEADQMMKALKDRIGVGPWIQRQHKLALEQGYVTTPLGRRRRFPLITPQNVSEVCRQSVNAPTQGTGSDLMLISLIEINKWIHSERGKILFPVHDSLVLEVPTAKLFEIAKRVRDTMLAAPAKALNTDLPWKVDVEAGSSYEEDLLVKVEGL